MEGAQPLAEPHARVAALAAVGGPALDDDERDILDNVVAVGGGALY